jgi:hypothetical protein
MSSISLRKDLTMDISVRFHEMNGKLIRTVTIEGKTFRE